MTTSSSNSSDTTAGTASTPEHQAFLNEAERLFRASTNGGNGALDALHPAARAAAARPGDDEAPRPRLRLGADREHARALLHACRGDHVPFSAKDLGRLRVGRRCLRLAASAHEDAAETGEGVAEEVEIVGIRRQCDRLLRERLRVPERGLPA